MAKSFKELRESVVKTADKKPEKYTKPDGKVGIRMVPVDKQIVKNEAKVDEGPFKGIGKAMMKAKIAIGKNTAKNQANTDSRKADAAADKGDMTGYAKNKSSAIKAVDRYKRLSKAQDRLNRESTQVDEVLDTPKTYNSYKRKAKRSAQNAHDDRMFGRRSPEDNKRNDKTWDKRAKGLAMADRARNRTFNKRTGQGYTNKPLIPENFNLYESFDHSYHQDDAHAHYHAALHHEDHGHEEIAAHHHKASDHHDEAFAAHEKGDHTMGAYHTRKAWQHSAKARMLAKDKGGEHAEISHLAHENTRHTYDAGPKLVSTGILQVK